MERETIVRSMVSTRKGDSPDLAEVLQTLANGLAGGLTAGPNAAKGKAGSKYSTKGILGGAGGEVVVGGDATEAGLAPVEADRPEKGAVAAIARSEAQAARPPKASPAELPQSGMIKQAAKLAEKFPDSPNMQRMLQQITNPKVSAADKGGILALMNSEANMLAEELDMEI